MNKGLLAILTLVFCLSTAKSQHTAHKRPTYLYAHGLADTGEQAHNYEDVLFTGPVITFDFPDATREFYRVNIAEANLGQKEDIDRLAAIYYKELESAPEAEFVGIGCSRGAATWLNFMGMHGHEQTKALVLESPFDSIANTVDPAMHGMLPLVFQKYDPNGVQPRDVIAKIPKDLPILIVCVKDDPRVPFSSTVEVYRLLRNSGHSNVHILAFESGKHGKFVLGDNREVYRNVAHAFYKKYGFTHNKEHAIAGQERFEKTQPEPQELL